MYFDAAGPLSGPAKTQFIALKIHSKE